MCFSVNGSVCYVCCVLDSVYELFGETICTIFWCGCYFLLHVMECLVWVEVLLLDIPCIVFQRMCVVCLWSQCASKYSYHMFCLCFVCRKLYAHLRV